MYSSFCEVERKFVVLVKERKILGAAKMPSILIKENGSSLLMKVMTFLLQCKYRIMQIRMHRCHHCQCWWSDILIKNNIYIPHTSFRYNPIYTRFNSLGIAIWNIFVCFFFSFSFSSGVIICFIWKKSLAHCDNLSKHRIIIVKH